MVVEVEGGARGGGGVVLKALEAAGAGLCGRRGAVRPVVTEL